MKVKNSGKYVFIEKGLEETFYTMKILMGCFLWVCDCCYCFSSKIKNDWHLKYTILKLYSDT